MASRFSFYSFPGYEFLISTILFLISVTVFSLVKFHHRLAFANKLLISRIDFLLVEISFLISIITLLLVKMQIPDINN